MFRRNFLQIAGVGLASSVTGLPILAKEIEKSRPLSTGSKDLDDLLKTDKEQVLIRLFKMGYEEKFLNYIIQLNDPSTYSIIESNNVDFNNLPTSKYIFVKEDLGGLTGFIWNNILYPHINHISVYSKNYKFESDIKIMGFHDRC